MWPQARGGALCAWHVSHQSFIFTPLHASSLHAWCSVCRCCMWQAGGGWVCCHQTPRHASRPPLGSSGAPLPARRRATAASTPPFCRAVRPYPRMVLPRGPAFQQRAGVVAGTVRAPPLLLPPPPASPRRTRSPAAPGWLSARPVCTRCARPRPRSASRRSCGCAWPTRQIVLTSPSTRYW